MTLAKEVMGAGFSAGQAQALGGQTNAALAATGSVQGDAATVNASNVIVTGADGTVGVILPADYGSVTIFNNAGSTLKVYPPSGAAIAVTGTGLGSANAAYSHTTYAVVTYQRVSSTQWFPTKSA
jgi:hypothetical protein